MGYYTNFELEIIEGPDVINNLNKEDFITHFRNITGHELGYLNGIKWYAYQDNMLEISRKYPTSLFKLSGVGEDSLDIWQEYYFNGKSVRTEGEIVFKEPDLTKLREPT